MKSEVNKSRNVNGKREKEEKKQNAPLPLQKALQCQGSLDDPRSSYAQDSMHHQSCSRGVASEEERRKEPKNAHCLISSFARRVSNLCHLEHRVVRVVAVNKDEGAFSEETGFGCLHVPKSVSSD